jgi:hypothetical protein
MKKITIEIPERDDERHMFDVVDENGRRCDGLSFDEMLGQVVFLTIGAVAAERIGCGFAMRTPEEWAAHRSRSSQQTPTFLEDAAP